MLQKTIRHSPCTFPAWKSIAEVTMKPINTSPIIAVLQRSHTSKKNCGNITTVDKEVIDFTSESSHHNQPLLSTDSLIYKNLQELKCYIKTKTNFSWRIFGDCVILGSEGATQVQHSWMIFDNFRKSYPTRGHGCVCIACNTCNTSNTRFCSSVN